MSAGIHKAAAVQLEANAAGAQREADAAAVQLEANAAEAQLAADAAGAHGRRATPPRGTRPERNAAGDAAHQRQTTDNALRVPFRLEG